MFGQVLYCGAKPVDGDDRRSAGQRRVDALRDLCRSILDHGLPTDRGLRPHLFLTTTPDRLHTAAAGDSDTSGQLPAAYAGETAEPAQLHGYGAVSDLLLSKLACDCTITPVLVDAPGPQPHVLDVGRTTRLATLKQRQAIMVQQGGVCSTPGCDNTHLEIHHITAWTHGGQTDLANLRGYCTRCHHLIHLGQLVVTPDSRGGWTHRTRTGRYLPDHRRRTQQLTHTFLTQLLRNGVHEAATRAGSDP